MEFRGEGLPLTPMGLAEACEDLGVRAAELWAVLTVETRGCGFLPDRRPLILFERHVFHRRSRGRFDERAPDLSNPSAGGYGAAGAHQHDRLRRAIELDRHTALLSASWGIGQVMGFNAKNAGFACVEAMVAAMARDEDTQLASMAGEIASSGLARSLRAHDWTSFARGYNGSNFAINRYDTRLAAAHDRFRSGLLPDLAVRSAQVHLLYQGFQPGPVDGLLGRFTRDALEQFQAATGLPQTGEPDGATLEALQEGLDRDGGPPLATLHRRPRMLPLTASSRV